MAQHATHTHTFTLISGESVTVELTPELDAYVARLRSMASDASVGLQTFIDVLYHEDNPALTKGVIPGRGLVTLEVLHSPIWAVMSDLEQQKMIAIGVQQPYEDQGKAFTMTAAEAARQLGVTTNAVRMAIKENRLAGRKIANRWMVLPSSVDAYAVSVRGPGNKLECTIGHVKGYKFSMRFDDDATLTRTKRASGQPQSVVNGHLSSWRWAVLLTSQTFEGDSRDRNASVQSNRLQVITPDDSMDPQEITLDRFFVRGRFRVIHRISNNDKAKTAWKGDLDAFVARLSDANG